MQEMQAIYNNAVWRIVPYMRKKKEIEMNTIELFWRFVLGGTLITGISILAKTKIPYISGLLVLFPAVTLVGYYFIGQAVSPNRLKDISLFSIYTLPTTLIFLITFYMLQGKYNLNQILVFSILSWIFAAGILVLFNNYYFKIGIYN